MIAQQETMTFRPTLAARFGRYDKEHPAIELLKLKSFEASVKFDISEILQKDFVSKTSKKLILLKPLNEFINRALATDEF
mgnify:CR=1 FL=1